MTDFADLPLDSEDQAILDRLAAIYTQLDPPPADLDERVSFAIALEDVDVEVARLSGDLLVGSGARCRADPHDHIRRRKSDRHGDGRRPSG